ncbi:MAG: YkoP family protein [Stellaceae bacterium]
METYLDLGRVIRSAESLLRRRHGIYEFTDDEKCIFRLALSIAVGPITLSDGITVQTGDPILDLHFWNEQLPVMRNGGRNLAWANLMKCRYRHSLTLVADHVERDASLDPVVAIRGTPSFNTRLGTAQVIRFAQRLGFDVVEPGSGGRLIGHVYEVFDGIALWGLTYSYNPNGLRRQGVRRHRHQVWISRTKLLEHHGSGSGRLGLKAWKNAAMRPPA